ncbi:MAG TPA: YihY/virulence factor BrkB family protein [Anaeromyxobacter sp.]
MRLPGDGMGWKEFFTGLKDEMSRDGITDLAASVTFYGILALFPFLLFLVALASVIIKPDQAQALVDELAQVAPGPATQIVGEWMQQLGGQQNVTLLGFGAVVAIWAASGGVMAVVGALNRCYDVKEGRPWWKVRGTAIAMTIVSGVLALVAALVAVATAPLADVVGGPAGVAIGWLRLPVAGLIMMLLWALLYYVLPDVEQTFRFITPGSVLGVVLWVMASWGFSKYVSNFGSYDKTYGSLGGVIVLLLWMWISSFVLLVGAEVNALIEHRSPEGKRQGAKRRSEVGLQPVATSAPVDEPLPATQPARAAPAPRRKAPVRGLVAIAAGIAAGVLLARREA